jgi:hypothetical protein
MTFAIPMRGKCMQENWYRTDTLTFARAGVGSHSSTMLGTVSTATRLNLLHRSPKTKAAL